MHSVTDTTVVVQSFIAKELAEERVLRPWPVAFKRAVSVQVSCFGVIPKPMNLVSGVCAHPPEHSMNEEVDPDLFSLVYALVGQAASGLGCLSV